MEGREPDNGGSEQRAACALAYYLGTLYCPLSAKRGAKGVGVAERDLASAENPMQRAWCLLGQQWRWQRVPGLRSAKYTASVAANGQTGMAYSPAGTRGPLRLLALLASTGTIGGTDGAMAFAGTEQKDAIEQTSITQCPARHRTTIGRRRRGGATTRNTTGTGAGQPKAHNPATGCNLVDPQLDGDTTSHIPRAAAATAACTRCNSGEVQREMMLWMRRSLIIPGYRHPYRVPRSPFS